MSVKIPVNVSTSAASSRRGKFYISGLGIRLLIALIISWLIIMAFFITNVASR